MASNRLQIVNASKHRTARVDQAIDAMHKALNIQLRDVARKPFQIAPDGYVIHHTANGVRNIWGRQCPRWRRAAKRAAGSRTHIRHRLG